jgi:hypothetical protein
MPLPVVRKNNTITPAGVAWHHFPCQKCHLTWRMLPRQYMWLAKMVKYANFLRATIIIFEQTGGAAAPT